MELGMIGLGRMGGNMTERLVRGGHRVVGFARKEEARKRVIDKGAESAVSLEALTAQLKPPRTLWMMVPAGALDPVHDCSPTKPHRIDAVSRERLRAI